jgi:hypothetical protein
MKLIICGGSDTIQFMPKDIKGEIWGINDTAFKLPRVDTIFELHTREIVERCVRTPDYLQRLKDFKGRVFMQNKHKDIKSSVKFPVNKLTKKYGKKFVSSIDYMIAYAIEEGYKDIELWGVDLAVYEEYLYQRPSAMYWIGYAKGLGIKVTVQENSGINFENLYGYENSQENSMVELLNQVYVIKNQIKLINEDLAYTEGVLVSISRLIQDRKFDLIGMYKIGEKKKLNISRLKSELEKKLQQTLDEISFITGHKVIIPEKEIEIKK